MNPVALFSSPRRGLLPRLDATSSPSVAGVPRFQSAQWQRSVPQPPASPTRSAPIRHQSASPCPQAPRERDVATPASSYSSRQHAPPDASRREDETHDTTQLILLLTMSVVLLTLPWVVDHPVTLLVPVALLILPITSGALRSIMSEAGSLLFGGFRWFWRHRKTAKASTPQRSSAAAPAQPFGGLPGLKQNPGHQQPQAAYHQAAGPTWAPHHAQSHMQSHAATRSMDQHHRLQPQVPMPPSPGRLQPPLREWPQQGLGAQHPQQRPQSAMHGGLGAVSPANASVTDLGTPDLDFESDSDAVRMTGTGRQPYPYPAVPHAHHGHQHSSHAQPATYYQPPAPPPQQQQTSWQAADQQAECDVRNWDEPECSSRRGHRPSLEDLLSNGQ